MHFCHWDESIHEDEEQKKRLERAKKSDVKPLSVDFDEQSCFIKGSGKEPYYVTLESCTCSDFVRRKLPCKHVYRLALELGLISDNYMTGINRKELNALMYSLPVDSQEALFDMCCCGSRSKFLFPKDNKYLPLIVNGFCVESVDDFVSAAKESYCAELRELIAKSGLDNLPDERVRLKTLIAWLEKAQTEQLDKMQKAFTAIELTPETVELRNTIVKRFKDRFDRIEYDGWENSHESRLIKRFVQDGEVLTNEKA